MCIIKVGRCGSITKFVAKYGDQEIDLKLDLRVWTYGEISDGPRPGAGRASVGSIL